MIDACAQLAKKLVTNQSLSGDGDQPSVDQWFSGGGIKDEGEDVKFEEMDEPDTGPPLAMAADEEKPELRLIQDEAELKPEITRRRTGRPLVVIGSVHLLATVFASSDAL